MPNPLIPVTSQVAVVASGNSGAGVLVDPVRQGITFWLGFTDIALAAGDSISVKIQTSPDGVRWVDVLGFAGVIGTTAEPLLKAKSIYVSQPFTEANEAISDGTIAADGIECHFGSLWRARWIVAGATPNFTFTIDALPF